MSVVSFAIKMLKREYKKSLTYSFVLLFSMFISFIFIDIIDNPYLIAGDVSTGGASWAQVYIPLSKLLPFLIICVCWVMILYASDYYLNKKLKEFSLIYLSGGTFIHIVCYVTIQIFIILVIVIPLSYYLGSIALIHLYEYMYAYLSIDVVYSVPFSTHFGTSFTILPIVMTILLSIAGFSHRNTIQVLLGRSENSSGISLKGTKFKSPIYFLLYCLGIFAIITQTHYSVAYVIPTLIGTYAMYGIIKQTIPKLVRKWVMSGGIDHSPLFISLSNYVISIQGTIMMSLLMLCLVTLLVPILIGQEPFSNEYFTAILSYVSIVVLLVIGIVCKYCDLVSNRRNEFLVLAKVGYTYNERKQIIIYEALAFYFTILLIPLPYIICIGTKFVIYDNLSFGALSLLVIYYLLPSLISIFITIIIYNKSVNILPKGEAYE